LLVTQIFFPQWFLQNSGTTAYLSGMFFIDTTKGWAVGSGGTFEHSQIIELEINTPNEYSLEQKFPYPFNPSAKIRYVIPSNVKDQLSNLSLKVYDVLVNEIAVLVNEEQLAGRYEVEFYSSTLSSSVSAKGGYASGVYFFQLKTGEFISTKKIVLLK